MTAWTTIDLGLVRGLGTAILFVAFVALWTWAWHPRQRRRFEEAACLPFLDERGARPAGAEERHE
jgi:cytochrome c oxidase cbb3-type subunit 4